MFMGFLNIQTMHSAWIHNIHHLTSLMTTPTKSHEETPFFLTVIPQQQRQSLTMTPSTERSRQLRLDASNVVKVVIHDTLLSFHLSSEPRFRDFMTGALATR